MGLFRPKGLDLDTYRAELVDMGASGEDADAAVTALREQQNDDEVTR